MEALAPPQVDRSIYRRASADGRSPLRHGTALHTRTSCHPDQKSSERGHAGKQQYAFLIGHRDLIDSRFPPVVDNAKQILAGSVGVDNITTVGDESIESRAVHTRSPNRSQCSLVPGGTDVNRFLVGAPHHAGGRAVDDGKLTKITTVRRDDIGFAAGTITKVDKRKVKIIGSPQTRQQV
jgi:hypothetical protein